MTSFFKVLKGYSSKQLPSVPFFIILLSLYLLTESLDLKQLSFIKTKVGQNPLVLWGYQANLSEHKLKNPSVFYG